MADDDIHALAASLHEHLQQEAERFLTAADDQTDLELPDTGVLTGWFLVTEWHGTDNQPWLTYHWKPGQPQWLSRGLLAEAQTDL